RFSRPLSFRVFQHNHWKSGSRISGPSVRLLTDCVEKALSGARPNFLRAAGSLSALGREGPRRRGRIHSAAFPYNLTGDRQPKLATGSLLRKFH
ncbi:hypothetical protein, partial [Bradyrhizobium sp.]|uniref:hypothetical protein n=1 Tax=Bradyrhizobium sp. TaxID=376 RepID=UPI003C1E3940